MKGGLLVVLGDSGVGKSTLLDLAAAAGRRAGARVLRTRALALEYDVPFGVVRALLGPRADESAPLNRLHLLVEELAEASPLVLLIDDAHDADDLSLRAIAFAGRRLAGLPVALVVAGRPVRGTGVGMLDLAAVEHATALRPRALSPAGTATFVRRRHANPQAAFVAACHQATKGNPLLLRELLLVVDEEGLAPVAAAAGRVRAIGPASVSRRITLALRRLPEEATDVVRAVAVLEGEASWAVIARLARVELDEALRAGALLTEAGVLDASDRPDFEHPIVRAAVLAELLPPERALAHRRAAALLDEVEAPVERIAGHLLHTPPGGDARACAVLREVARAAGARGAPDSATRLLRRALAEPPPDGERLAVLRELARAAAAAGTPDAVELLAEVEAGATQPPDRARAALEHGSALFADGRFAEACAVFDAAREQLTDEDRELDFELRTAWAGAAVWMGARSEEIGARLGETLAQPDAGGAWQRRLQAAAGMAEALRAGDRGQAVGLALWAWDDGHMLDHLDFGDSALWAVAATLLQSGELDAVEEILVRVLEAARVAGAFDAHASASCALGQVYECRGNLPAAEAAVGVALDAHADGWETFLLAALWLRTRCRLERGDVEGAAAGLATPAADDHRRKGSPVLLAALHAARGAVALAQHEPAEALGHFRAQGRSLAELGSHNPAFFGWHAGAATACHQLRRHDEAVAHAEADLAIARGYGVAATTGAALRVRAGLEDAADAVAPLTEAVSLLAGTPERLHYGRALVDLGVALRVIGRRSAAQESLRAGLAIAAACDATALSSRAREELVTAGGRPRRAELSGPASLTPGERRVADLAVSGLTNRGIAEALFVTRKAVEFHLANVYRKLDVRRREELVARLAIA